MLICRRPDRPCPVLTVPRCSLIPPTPSLATPCESPWPVEVAVVVLAPPRLSPRSASTRLARGAGPAWTVEQMSNRSRVAVGAQTDMVLANERGWREESERGAEPAARSLKARPLLPKISHISARLSLTHAPLHTVLQCKSRFLSHAPPRSARASPRRTSPITSASLSINQHRDGGPPKDIACIAHHARCCCCCADAGTAGNRSFLRSSSSAVRIHASLLSSVSPYDKARSLRGGTRTHTYTHTHI